MTTLVLYITWLGVIFYNAGLVSEMLCVKYNILWVLLQHCNTNLSLIS